jgi:membrane fusion protein (multidrug efflux system)
MTLPVRSSVLAATFFILIGTGCSRQAPTKEMQPPAVMVVAAASRSLPVYSEYIGETYGLADVDVVSRVEGWVTGIHFKEGETVREGQLLYTIDDSQLLNQQEVASSQLAAQEVLLAKSKADFERVEPLAAINALSRRDLDAARAAYEAQQKSVEAARAVYRNAQLQTSYARITSPITGVIGISTVQVGDMVSRSIGAKALNTVSATGEIRIRFSIPETDFLRYQREWKDRPAGQPYELDVYLSDGTLFPEKARLDFTNRSLDPRTGSLLVQAVVSNSGVERLRPGQFVKVRAVSKELNDAVIVPQQAVRQLQTIYQVFVVGEGDTLRARQVTPGLRVGSNWVITEGLKAGERVAIVGNLIVKPNAPVESKPMNWSYDSTLVN